MAKGHENLKPLTQRTKEERREICSKGGKASVAARRRKKNMREIFRMLKDLPVTDAKMKAQLRASGIKEDDATYSAAMAFSAMYHAMKGNSQMMRLVFEMMGESPDIRMRERELKLKEKALDIGHVDTTLNVTIKAKERQGDGGYEGG